jgi:hypothetical protein
MPKAGCGQKNANLQPEITPDRVGEKNGQPSNNLLVEHYV